MKKTASIWLGLVLLGIVIYTIYATQFTEGFGQGRIKDSQNLAGMNGLYGLLIGMIIIILLVIFHIYTKLDGDYSFEKMRNYFYDKNNYFIQAFRIFLASIIYLTTFGLLLFICSTVFIFVPLFYFALRVLIDILSWSKDSVMYFFSGTDSKVPDINIKPLEYFVEAPKVCFNKIASMLNLNAKNKTYSFELNDDKYVFYIIQIMIFLMVILLYIFTTFGNLAVFILLLLTSIFSLVLFFSNPAFNIKGLLDTEYWATSFYIPIISCIIFTTIGLEITNIIYTYK
jgi:hypothetical protein